METPWSGELSAPEASRWTPRAAARRVRDVYREEGARKLLIRTLGATVYRRMLLLERLTQEPVPDIVSKLELDFDLIRDETEYLECRPDLPPEFVRHQFEIGGLCFVARYRCRVASSTWAFRHRGPMPFLGREFQPRPDEFYLAGTWTDPRYRGLCIAPALACHMIEAGRKMGLRRLVCAVAPENRANLRARRRAGFRIFGKIGFVGVVPWSGSHRHFLKTHPSFPIPEA